MPPRSSTGRAGMLNASLRPASLLRLAPAWTRAPPPEPLQQRELFPYRFGRGYLVVQEEPLPGVCEPVLKRFAAPTASNDEKTIELWRVHRPEDIPSDVF